ncbi:MAG: aldo/keto reductase [Paracraurococcus sp.]
MYAGPLGHTGLTVSAIGIGCSRLGSTLGQFRGALAERLLHHALDTGVTLFDTADIYGQGDSERLLGAALRGRRDRVVIISKAGQRFTPAQRLASLAKRPLAMAARHVAPLADLIAARRAGPPPPPDISPAHLRTALDGSLRRLGTDRLDIFLLHSPPARALDAAAATVALLQAERAAGRVLAWGVSCDDAASLAAALRLPGLGVVQVPLALAQEETGRGLLAMAAARGTGLLFRELAATAAGGLGDPAGRRLALAAALDWPGSAAIIGTTRPEHLDALHAALPVARLREAVAA